jgi:hypothetical protein
MEPARPPNYRFRGIVSAPAFREPFLAAALPAPVKRRNRQSVAPAHLPHSTACCTDIVKINQRVKIDSDSHLGLESGKFFNISFNQDCDAKSFVD